MKFLIYRKDNRIKFINFQEIERIDHFAINQKDEFVVSIQIYADRRGRTENIDFYITQYDYYLLIVSIEDKDINFVNLDEYIKKYVDYEEEQ